MQEPSNLIRMSGNVYDESALSDLYTGASLELAIAQYKDAIATSCTPKEAFRFTVWSIERMHRKIGVNEEEDVVLPSYEDTVNEILENGPDPKTRLFTPDEMAIAIEFFTQKQIPVEDVVLWGRGIDPYGNEGLSESDYYTGLTREGYFFKYETDIQHQSFTLGGYLLFSGKRRRKRGWLSMGHERKALAHHNARRGGTI